ncbi:MAG: hypothetical protein M5U28_27300 [Sandaracinaceae bacterium]|nr:hypothetical protein [Sandaracinaceae bacterium]
MPRHAAAGDQRAVSAADVDEHPLPALAADLGVAARRVEVRVRIEGDLVVRQPAEAHDVAVELDHAPGVRPEGLVETDHAARRPRARAT